MIVFIFIVYCIFYCVNTTIEEMDALGYDIYTHIICQMRQFLLTSGMINILFIIYPNYSIKNTISRSLIYYVYGLLTI